LANKLDALEEHLDTNRKKKLMTNASSRLGQVKVEGTDATLTFTRRLAHPPETVWKAITEPEELSKWYMSQVSIEGRVGGKVDYSSETGHVTGNILTWDPPLVFEHEWVIERPGSPKGDYGVIRWELVRDGDGTLLTLTHRKLPSQVARHFAPGVHASLDRLEAYVNDAPMPDWIERSEELRKIYSD
jgi:uncharacterized protein YndB with AHSA1/START domain